VRFLVALYNDKPSCLYDLRCGRGNSVVGVCALRCAGVEGHVFARALVHASK
jgi:hypothetical protein